MSLRVVIIGLMMVTAVALGLVGYQIANPALPMSTAVAPVVPQLAPSSGSAPLDAGFILK